MKKFDIKQLRILPGKLFAILRNILSGNEEERNAQVVDFSNMQERPQGNRCHFLFALLFGLSIAAALWQHGSPRFTVGTILLLIPLSFFVYVPYRWMDILLRQLIGCLIFLGSCLWLTYRLRMDVMFDIAFVEVLVLCTFAFFINCNRRDYSYIFLISILLIIYSGLIPRTILLYLIPGAMGSLLISFAVERSKALSGTGTLHESTSPAPIRTLKRTWHFYLMLLLLFVPVFLLIFSFIPLKMKGDEGFFEVSFSTTRKSVMPPDLKKWLGQDKKFLKDENAENTTTTDEQPDVADNQGKKKVSSDLPGEEMGSGKSAPPGKELLFTVNMPVKLYHLAALYDFYDGKKWITTEKFTKSRVIHSNKSSNRSFQLESKYTIQKWISPSLYAPYRPVDFMNHIDAEVILSKQWTPQKYHIKQGLFTAKLKSIEKGYPATPYIYSTRSILVVPVKPKPPVAKNTPVSPVITAPEIYTSAEEYFAHIRKKDHEWREKLRIAAEKRAAAAKAAAERKKAALKAAAAKRLAAQKAAAAKQKKNIKPGQKQTAKKPAPAKPAVKKPVAKPAVKKPVAVKKPAPKKTVRKPAVARDPAWLLSLPASHFLQVPEKLSPRITELAKDITKNIHTPYEKAIALRDHLRTHYQYKLYADPVPADKESVEYFLFELKEGHCEYFAAALTILARCAGLPARVATGFSPGNYNAMTGQIEVYEYHAHAWSQIFIAGTGWLTFDGVPPGEIVSQTTPVGIGRFRDPFGDQWRIMPPEMTQEALEFVQKELIKDAAEREANRLMQLEAMKQHKKVQAESQKKEIVKKDIKTVTQKPREVKPTGIKERLQKFTRICKEKLKNAIRCLLSAPGARNAIVVVVIALVILLICFRRILHFLGLLISRHRSLQLLEQARLIQENDPAQSILCSYRALRLFLILARMERRKNMELLAYASAIRQTYLELLSKKYPEDDGASHSAKSEQLEQDLRLVFNHYYAVEYGKCPCSPADATDCAKAVTSIHATLKELLPYSLLP